MASSEGPGPSPRSESHQGADEGWLEAWLASMRSSRSLAVLERLPTPLHGLDLGCGFRGDFVRLADAREGWHFRGGDLEVDPQDPRLFAFDFSAPAAPEGPVQVVTMHAVLEHVEDDVGAVRWVHDRLEPGGRLVLTVPSPRAKPVLEFLAYRLGVISEVEIRDHKRYYDRPRLEALLCGPDGPFASMRHESFQLGMNNFVVATKAVLPSGE